MSRDAIEAVTRRLEMAKTFAEIFGPVLNDSDLKHAFRKLAKLVHPDMAAQRDQQIASEAFNLLEKFYRAAGEELAAHRYDRSFAPGVHLNGRPNTLSSGIIQSSRGGLIHSAFGDENADCDYWLYHCCDKCGSTDSPE